MSSQLIVKISGDSKQLASEYKKVAKQTEDLERQIGTATKASAAAFVGFAGAIGLAANEAAKLETIGVQFEVLTGNAELAKQTVKELTDFAAKTPFQFKDVAKAGQQLLGFGFEAESLQDKLRGIGDVAAAVGAPMKDLTLIFGQVKAAGKLTGERLLQLQERAVPIGPALAKSMGVAEESIKDLVSKGQVDFATFEKAFASISEKGGIAFEGMKKRSETLEGVISTLKDNFSFLAADIGKQFLPVLKTVAVAMTKFIQFLRANPVFASIAGKVLALGAALSGIVTVLGTATLAFFKIRAAILAANIATKTLSLGVKGLVGATGLGLLLIVASEIYANWDTIWPLMSKAFEGFADGVIKWINVIKRAFQAFINVIGDIASAYVGIWKAALTFDFDAVRENVNKLKDTLVNSASKIRDEIQDEMNKQDKIIEMKVSARKEETGGEGESQGVQQTKKNESEKTKAVDQGTKDRIAALKNEQAILKAERDGQSAQQIEFLKRRQEIDKEFAESQKIKNQEERELALENVRMKNQELLEEEREATERRREQEAEIREEDAELAAEIEEAEREARTEKEQQELERIRENLLTRKEAEREVQNERLSQQVESNNQRLKDEVKYGKAYAKINQALNNSQLQGARQAAGQLVALTESKNNTLKSIGKAAALTQIGIDTAKGATAAYASLAPIPFIGPALGIAAAAALIAFGVEQAQNVLSANKGGRVPFLPGSIPGQDSVNASLTPGELIVPDQNFDEVVNAVAAQRSRADTRQTEVETGQNNSSVININGDVLADETFIDRLIDGINEAVEERNAPLTATTVI